MEDPPRGRARDNRRNPISQSKSILEPAKSRSLLRKEITVGQKLEMANPSVGWSFCNNRVLRSRSNPYPKHPLPSPDRRALVLRVLAIFWSLPPFSTYRSGA